MTAAPAVPAVPAVPAGLAPADELALVLPQLRAGMLVVTSTGPDVFGRLMTWRLGNPYTHAFVVTAPPGKPGNPESAAEAPGGLLAESMFTWRLSGGVREVDLRARFAEVIAARRAYAVLDPYAGLDPAVAALARAECVEAARAFAGVRYDELQAFYFAVFRRFWRDGPKRMICSRFVSAVCERAGARLFTPVSLALAPGLEYPRLRDLARQYCTPDEVLFYARPPVVLTSRVPDADRARLSRAAQRPRERPWERSAERARGRATKTDGVARQEG